jgi:hypothetical protein
MYLGSYHKDKIGEVPEGKKKPSFVYWIKDAEKERYDGFEKMAIFTDKGRCHSEKIVKTYNQKSLV